jgi:hypothetical protein
MISPAYAVNRYWVAAGSANWNTSANWSTASGGMGGASVPGSTDAAIFDGNGPGNCTLNINVTLTTLNVKAAYTGTIIQGNYTVTTSGTATFAGGTFTGGTAEINFQGTFTLSGTAFTSTNNILELNANAAFTGGSFIANNGTVQFNSTAAVTLTISGTSPTLYTAEFVGLGRTYDITATGDLQVTNALNLSGSSYITLNKGTIEVTGDINITNTATGGGGTTTILINGTGNQNINGSTTSGYGALPIVNIDKTSGNLNLYNIISFAGDLTYTAGTLVPGTSTVELVGSLTITGSFTVYNLEIDGAAAETITIATGDILTSTGTFDMENSSNDITINKGTIAAEGNITDNNAGISGGGTGTILINGSSSQNITSTGVLDQGKFPAVTITNTVGTVTFPSLITVTGNWTYNSGSLDVNTNNATVVFENTLTISGTLTLNNVTFNANAIYTITFSTGTLLTVTGTLTTEGNSNLSLSSPTAGTDVLEAQGNITVNNSGTTGGGNGEIMIDGTANQLFSSSAAAQEGWLPYILIIKTGGTLTMSGTISETRNWTYTSGTVDAITNSSTVVFGSHNLNVKSDGMSFYNATTVSSNTTLGNDMTAANNVTMSGTGVLIPGAHTINVGGSWTDYGAGFTEGTSTVVFNGTGIQYVSDPSDENFYNLTTDNSGSEVYLQDDINIANKLTMTSGNIELDGNTVTLGTSAAAPGTLSYTAGSMVDVGYFTRWITAATIAAGNVKGLFPMGAISGDLRPFHVSVPTTAPSAGGTITVSHTYINDWRYINVIDEDGTLLVTENDSYWTLTSGNGLTGGTYDLRGEGTGFGVIANVNDLRLILQSSWVGDPGANGGTTADPQVNRTNVSLTDLNNSFFIATDEVNDVLPLNLVSFTAKPENGIVAIDWKTENEQQISYFGLERSSDGLHWETMQSVPDQNSADTAAVLNYSATDGHPLSGISYYRLQIMEVGGKQAYSQAVEIAMNANNTTLQVYPNPASGIVYISFPNAMPRSVALINAAGQTVQQLNVADSYMGMDLSSYSQGIYFIRVSSSSGIQTIKILIRH